MNHCDNTWEARTPCRAWFANGYPWHACAHQPGHRRWNPCTCRCGRTIHHNDTTPPHQPTPDYPQQT